MNFSCLKSKSFLVPTGMLAVYLLLALTALSSGEREYNPLWRTLIQWDGQHYLSIARDGYERFPCPEDPTLICGNVGWFPGLPLLAGFADIFLGTIGLDMTWIILIVSWICFWLALLVLYKLVELRFGASEAAMTTVALLVFPASFYFLTAFPYALYLLLAASVFLLLEQKHYWWCALPAGLLAITYPSGITITLPLLWILLRHWRDHSASQRAALFTSGAAVGLALCLYFLYNAIVFDDFFLYVHFQQKPYYAHETAFPLIPMFESFTALPLNHPIPLMLLFVIGSLILFYVKRVPVAWQIFMFAVLLFTPTAGTTTSYYRHIVVAFPLYVMIAVVFTSTVRRWLAPAYVIGGLVLMWVVYLRLYKLGGLM